MNKLLQLTMHYSARYIFYTEEFPVIFLLVRI